MPPSLLDQAVERRQSLGQIPDQQASRAWSDIARGRGPWDYRPNPWSAAAWAAGRGAALVVPRLAGPIPQAALQVLPHLLDIFPGVRGIDLGLLLRELGDQFRGAPGTAPRLQLRRASTGGWSFTANWSDFGSGCPIEAVGPMSVLGGGGTGCGSVGYERKEVWDSHPSTVESMQAFGAYDGLMASFSNVADAPLPPWNPGYYELRQGRVYLYVGPPVPAPATAEQPVYSEGSAQEVASPVGLDNPNMLRSARTVLGRLGLPGRSAAMATYNLPWWQQKAIDRLRWEFGLSEVVQPAPTPSPGAAPGGSGARYSDEFVNQLPGSSTQVYPVRQPAEPHVWQRPDPYVREHKIKITSAYVAAAFVMNAITETGDFLEQVHKALPDHCKKARPSKKGNLRFDSMLRDLQNCPDVPAWDEAVVNIVANQLEDFYYGAQGTLATKAGNRLRRGQRQGGIGAGNALSGTPYGGERGEGVRRDDPIMNYLEATRSRVIQSLRRNRHRSGLQLHRR